MTGLLLIDKQPDWTSSDVVAKLRGILKERRIGHAGTLDPMATGLLLILVGRATRASDYAMAHDKTYLATLCLGASTDTQDTTGNIISVSDASEISQERLIAAAASFTGKISQLPPMYSAIKVKGKKLYDIARKGGTVDRTPRQITIHELSVVKENESINLQEQFLHQLPENGTGLSEWKLRIHCSSGTYIRTLCHDIGQQLGCGGCMAALRRIELGDFSVEDAVTIDQVQKAADDGKLNRLLLPVETLFQQYPSLTITSAEEKKIRCGNTVPLSTEDGFYRVFSETDEFLMLGLVKNGILKTEKSFFEVS